MSKKEVFIEIPKDRALLVISKDVQLSWANKRKYYALQCDANFSSLLKKNLVITCLDQMKRKFSVQELIEEMKVTYPFEKVYLSHSDCSENSKKYEPGL